MVADVTAKAQSSLGFLGPESELTRAIAAFDWTTTGLGAIDDWSGELRAAVGLMMGSDYPAAVWWSDELWLIHNEAYERHLLRERGRGIGRRFDDLWGEVAAQIRPQFDAVLESGRGRTWVDQRIDMLRDGKLAETWWSYSFTPVLDRDGRALGIFNGAHETTERKLHDRVNTMLIELDAAHLAAADIDAIVTVTTQMLGEKLEVNRVGFTEIDEGRTRVILRPNWTDSGADTASSWPGEFDSEMRRMDTGAVATVTDVHTDPRFSDPRARVYFDKLGIRAAVVCPVHDGSEAVGGLFVQSRAPRNWSDIDLAIIRAAAQRLWTSIGRAREAIAREASERRYRLIYEQADDIIFTADLDQVITDCNAAGARVMGMEREEIVGRSIADFVSPDDFRQTTAMLRQKLDEGGHTRHEVTVVARDGKRMRWENNSTLIVDRDDKPVGLLSISRDVTERRAFDERRELLIHELNHRVKNTLALVQALALQSFPSGGDTPHRDDFIARLGTLAAAHDLLTRDQWEGVTLAELARAATRPLDRDGLRVAIGGPDVRLCPKTAVALAMALHELGTNATKYGALSVEAGRVDLVWQHADGRVRIDWRERGGPPVTAPSRRGFGLRMIDRVLASDIGGHVTTEFAPGGLHCAIDAPEKGNLA